MVGQKERSIEIKIENLEKTFSEGYYVEAIILTHYTLETLMNHTLVYLINSLNPPFLPLAFRSEYLQSKGRMKKGNPKLAMSVYNYQTITSILMDFGVFDHRFRHRLEKFNTKRNIIAHRLLDELPSDDQINCYFKEGLALLKEMFKILEIFQKKSSESLKEFIDQNLKKGKNN